MAPTRIRAAKTTAGARHREPVLLPTVLRRRFRLGLVQRLGYELGRWLVRLTGYIGCFGDPGPSREGPDHHREQQVDGAAEYMACEQQDHPGREGRAGQ